MITVTREAEADMRALLATRLMLADEQDALRQAIDAIADARARGQRYLIVRINGSDPTTLRIVD